MAGKIELPFDPSQLTERQKREYIRNSRSAVGAAYYKKKLAFNFFLEAVNDETPSPKEIEDHRFAYLSASEAHLDAIIGLRGLHQTFGLKGTFHMPDDDDDED